MLTIREFLTPDEVATILSRMRGEAFVHGGETAQGRAKAVKNNLQLPLGGEAERDLDRIVRAAFERSDAVRQMVLPLHVLPARFSRCEAGMGYGWHVDSAVMGGPNGKPVRTDLACTIFLEPPSSYDGGELTVQLPMGQLRAKLPAGDAVIYPATSVHKVEEVTRGVRHVAVTWIQSMVASAEQRELMLDLLKATRDLRIRDPQAPELDRLTAVHANLVRMWGQT